MNFDDAKKLFVGTTDKTFLDSACVGLVPTTAKNAIAQFLDHVVHFPGNDVSEHHMAMDEMKEAAVVESAKLLNTEKNNLSLIENTSFGLNIAANSIPFTNNDEVLICETEYLQVAIPFIKKQQAQKLTVVPVTASQPGHFLFEDFERRVTKNTKAIVVSSVQWCTGQRVFSRQLGDFCRSRNIWLIVDGVQELGALNSDTSLRHCDFYIAGGHKWLNAPFGCGIMYMSPRAQQLEPPIFGYLNLPSPPQGWGKFFQQPSQTPFRDYDFPASTKSFGIGGTGNYPGAIGLAESMKIVNRLGPAVVEKRVLQLSQFLRDNLRQRNVKLISNHHDDESSGITIFRLFDSHEHDLKALDFIQRQRVYLSIRYTNNCGGLRASTHYFNNEEDVLRLCHAIEQLKNL